MYCKKCGAQLVDNAHYCHKCGTATGEESVHYVPVPWEDEATGASTVYKKQRSGFATFLLALLCLALCVVGEFVGAVAAFLVGGDEYLLGMLGCCVGAALGICVLGGTSLLHPRHASLGYALRTSWWLLAVSTGLTVVDAFGAFSTSFNVQADWLQRTWYALALCATIGFSEEAMFRGLLMGGLLDAFGSDRRGVMTAVVLSSVLFGAAHIEWWSLNYADPVQLAQAVLKIAQTGLFGFFLGALTICSKSILGPALIHGLADFIIFFYSYSLMGEGLEVDYVSSGSEGMETMWLYLVMIVLYIPLVVKGVRMLRDVPLPEHGAFHKE